MFNISLKQQWRMCRCEYIPLRFWISFVVVFESRYFETQASLYLDTFCLLIVCVGVCVCVCPAFEKAGRGGSYLSASFMRFPLNRFPLCPLGVCVCGKVCGRFHGTVPTLHSTSLHPFPLLHLHRFSLIYLSILFRPSVAAAPLSLSITPAVMRLNLSVSTGHAHAHTLYAHTLQSTAAHTHTYTQSST